MSTIDKDRLSLLQERLGIPSSSVPQTTRNISTGSPSTLINPGTQINGGTGTATTTSASPVPQSATTTTTTAATTATSNIIDICEEENHQSSQNSGSTGHWMKDGSFDTSNSKHKLSESDESMRKDGTPKRQKVESVDSSDNTNSRGAQLPNNVEGMRKIESYFTPQSQSEGVATQSIRNVHSRSHPPPHTPSSSPSHSHETTTKEQTNYTTSTTSPSLPFSPSSSSSSASASHSSHHPEKPTSVTELRKAHENLRIGKEQAEQKVLRLETELKISYERQRQLEDRCSRLCNALEDMHRLLAQQEGRRKRDLLAADCVRLGKISTMRSGSGVVEVWEEGYALKELHRKRNELNERKEELERRKNRLKNLRKKYTAASKKGKDGDLMLSVDDETDNGLTLISSAGIDLEISTEDLAIKTHESAWKTEEKDLEEELKMLEAEKASHMKELRRTQSEDHSRFLRDLPCLGKRYLLKSMLGRGGFSEVWKALDLVELKEVAVKVHQLNQSWSESRKQSYIKHVTREYTIHRELNHNRVVKLFDVFEIDMNSFATVLELCRGTDLDEKLKTLKQIPEKDAKTIVMQILAGLRYLNAPIANNNTTTTTNTEEGSTENGHMLPPNLPPPTPRKRGIIHFDLKPANILFDSMGDVKITDFGLSKVLDEKDEGNSSVELTSQGAGTYWYLPPECFCSADELPPRISSKVDVWSLGVIFYQMLFGKRPFGEGKSQERVLSEGIMLNATQVEFPHEVKSTSLSASSSSSSSSLSLSTSPIQIPKVTDEAKDFIRTCLTWDQKLRPDVLSLCQHPYIRGVPKKGKGAGAGAAVE